MGIGYSFYRHFLDPLLISLRTHVYHAVPEGASLLEVASGTGDMGFRLAPRISTYLGVDKSEDMVQGSKNRLSRMKPSYPMDFQHGDGSRLDHLGDNSFDMAMISLALHEMPPENRLPVLEEMKRCAGELLLVDYASPLPGNLKGCILHFAEYLAGGDHYRGFLSYQKQGGLDGLMDEAGLRSVAESSAIGGGIRVVRAVSARREINEIR